MSRREIDYPKLVEEALRSVAQKVLARVAEEGLPGEHHFFITFLTDHPELEIPASIRDTYPVDMTIVLQNEFWDLAVDDEAFEVSLRFDGEPCRLRVPWQAVRSFVDPAAEFGLRFEAQEGESKEPEPDQDRVEQRQSPGEVVSLEDFRKKDE